MGRSQMPCRWATEPVYCINIEIIIIYVVGLIVIKTTLPNICLWGNRYERVTSRREGALRKKHFS